MSIPAKLALSLAIIGWVVMVFSTVFGIATVNNAALQTIAIWAMSTGGAMVGVGVLIGLACLIKYIWE